MAWRDRHKIAGSAQRQQGKSKCALGSLCARKRQVAALAGELPIGALRPRMIRGQHLGDCLGRHWQVDAHWWRLLAVSLTLRTAHDPRVVRALSDQWMVPLHLFFTPAPSRAPPGRGYRRHACVAKRLGAPPTGNPRELSVARPGG